MHIEGRTILVLGGYGLVGMAVCRELLARRPKEIRIHSLRGEESEAARLELAPEAGATVLSTSFGDVFGSVAEGRLEAVRDQVGQLRDAELERHTLYTLLAELRPNIVIDCVNTATAIAYRNVFRSAETVLEGLEAGGVERGSVDAEESLQLLEALSIPRLIRHVQVLYRGMMDAGTEVYVKVGTSGTGGMGLNIPYTHSEEKPSRMLLAKSAIAGAHSMLLFLMARTPGAPITKEIKPAAAIAWKKIERGPIRRKGEPIRLVDAVPRPVGERFSTHDPHAAAEREDVLETVFIDTGENGIFSLEEFAMLTTAEQMEFVTPEEIARSLVFEIQGGNTGHDIVNALDNAVLGPTYRAGVMRHFALERMVELEGQGARRSVAFEMLGPPRNSKLLFEAHLLRQAFGSVAAVRQASLDQVVETLDELVRTQPEVANEVAAVGVPILLDNGEVIRGTKVIVPADADDTEVTPQRLDAWAHDGWVDLRRANLERWKARFERLHDEIEKIPPGDTSSRLVRTRRFWHGEGDLQPGKIVGWILSVEEHGDRFKR